MYLVDRKLGKGGFGQVYLGTRSPPSKDATQPNAVRGVERFGVGGVGKVATSRH